MKCILQLLLVLTVAACNSASKTDEAVLKDSVAINLMADSAANYIHTFADTVLEHKITTALLKLPFVKKSDQYIDSFSNHKHGIAFMMDETKENETDIPVRAGYNGDERFETYYWFFVNPTTMEIKVYDVAADKKLTVKEYIKSQR